MKTVSLGMALALLATGAAFAGTRPTTTAAAPASATPAMHKSAKECMNEARRQKLAGKAREEFLKKCQGGELTK